MDGSALRRGTSSYAGTPPAGSHPGRASYVDLAALHQSASYSDVSAAAGPYGNGMQAATGSGGVMEALREEGGGGGASGREDLLPPLLHKVNWVALVLVLINIGAAGAYFFYRFTTINELTPLMG